MRVAETRQLHASSFVDWKLIGRNISAIRQIKFGSNASQFVRYLNAQSKYNWDASSLHKLERGIYNASLERLAELAHILGVELASLFVKQGCPVCGCTDGNVVSGVDNKGEWRQYECYCCHAIWVER